jgi:hypothetical protein
MAALKYKKGVTKRCGMCKVIRPVAEFRKRTASPDGLQYADKKCADAYKRRWRAALKGGTA